MKGLKKLRSISKGLGRGSLAVMLAISLVFTFPTFAFADETTDGLGEPAATANEGLGQAETVPADSAAEETADDAQQDPEESDYAEEQEGSEGAAEQESSEGVLAQEDSETPAPDAEQDAIQASTDALSALMSETPEASTQTIEAFAAQNLDGQFPNTEGVANAISWKLTTDGTLTISGTGGIRDYAFHRTNGMSAFTGGMPAEDGTVLITQAEIYESIKTVVIGEGITSLGVDVFSPQAYSQIKNISSVSLPSTLTTINGAFKYVTTLSSITFAQNSQLTTIGSSSFERTGLTQMSIPSSVTSIGDKAFENCTSLQTVSFSDSLSVLGARAFYGCTSLVLADFHDSVTTIGDSAFYNCKLLALTSLPDSVATVGVSAFRGCTALALTSLPTTLTTIGDSAFRDCTALALTSLPTTLTTIGDSAFYGCTALALTSLPTTLTTIGDSAFSRCTFLATITLPEGMVVVPGSLFYGCTSLKTVHFPGSLTTIGVAAFSGCTSLALISLPTALTTISDSAFYGCTALALTSLPTTLTTIGGSAFSRCTSLVELAFSEGLESIGGSAFNGCTNLVIGWFPNSLKNIPRSAFNGCTKFPSLDRVSVSMGTTVDSGAFPVGTKIRYRTNMPVLARGSFNNAEGVEDAISWTLDTEGRLIITGQGGIGDFKFHKTSTESALSGGYTTEDETPVTVSQADAYDSIKTIIIDDDITTLGNSIFAGGGANIQTVSLPGTLTAIGNSAFEEAAGLTSITFVSASKLETIGNAAFKGCSSLVLSSFPATLTTIGSEAFSGCTSLAALSLTEGLETIGDEAFSGCTSLVTLSLTEGLKTIGSSAFANCTNLQVDWFPDSLESIGVNAFTGCTALLGLSMISVSMKTTLGAGAESEGSDVFPEGTKLVIRQPHPIVLSGTFANAEGTADAISWALEDGTLTINGTGGIGNNKFNKSNAASVFQSYVVEEDGTRVSAAMQYESITSVVVGESITSFGSYTFSLGNGDSANIQTVSLPSTLSSIGSSAFYNVGSLRTVTFALSSNLSTVNSSAFQNCTSLESINLPRSVVAIGGYAFSNCSSLTTITFFDGLESIEGNAFAGCTNLKVDWFPDSLANIDGNAFSNCSALLEVPKVEVSISEATSIASTAFPEGTNIVLREADGYYIAPGVIWAFSEDADGNTTLTVLSDGRAWTGSQQNSFFTNHPDCKAADVKHLVIEEGLVDIPTATFGASTFSGLESIYLASTVKTIAGNVFSSSQKLSSVTVAESSELTTISSSFAGCPLLTSLDLSDTQLTTIHAQAFASNRYGTSGLTEIFLPTTYTVVGGGAFAGTSNLKRISLPAATTIDTNAFQTTGLTSISLPTVTTINASAFDSSGMETIYVSRNIQYVDANLANLATNNAKMTVIVSGSSTTPIEGLDFANIAYEYYEDTTSPDTDYELSKIGNKIAFNCDNLGVPVEYTVTQLGAVDESSQVMSDFMAKAYAEEVVLQGTTSLAMEDAAGTPVEGLGRDVTLEVAIADEALKGREVQVYAWKSVEGGGPVFVQAATVDEGGIVKITKAQPNTSYAVYAMKPPTVYTVSFQSNGGTYVPSQTIEEGKLVTAPNAPVKSGYLFTGWYTGTDFAELFDFATPIQSNLTVYAGWELVEDEESNNSGGGGSPGTNSGGGRPTGGGGAGFIDFGAGSTGATQTAAATADDDADADEEEASTSTTSTPTRSASNSTTDDSEDSVNEDETSLIADNATPEVAPDQGLQWWWIVAGLAVVIAFLLGALLRKRRREDQ